MESGVDQLSVAVPHLVNLAVDRWTRGRSTGSRRAPIRPICTAPDETGADQQDLVMPHSVYLEGDR